MSTSITLNFCLDKVAIRDNKNASAKEIRKKVQRWLEHGTFMDALSDAGLEVDMVSVRMLREDEERT